jgi:PAS domain S-box-containing protein
LPAGNGIREAPPDDALRAPPIRAPEEARFRQMVESIQDYEIILLDVDGRVISWNPGAQRTSGYRAEEILGAHLHTFFPHDDRARGVPEEILARATRDGIVESEGWRLRKDGSQFWASVTITALRSSDGSLTGFSKFARDLTERRRGETELRDRETRLRALVETSVDGIVVFNAQGRIESFNPAAERMFGYALKEVRGRDVRLLCSSPDAALLGNRNAVGAQSESTGRRKDGSHFPMEVTLSEMILAEGRRITAIVRDISVRKKTEEELAHLTRSLAVQVEETRAALQTLQETQNQLIRTEKLASLGGLVAGIAHEINTPLGVGVTAASALRAWMTKLRKAAESGKATEAEALRVITAADEAAELALNNITRAADLVHSFKEVAVDQTSEQRRPVSLKHYIEEVLLSLAPSLKKARHAASVEGPDDLTVDTFPGAIAQIMTNFVTNSIMHAYPDGRSGRIIVSIRPDAQGTLLRYADDGDGISPTHLPRIFDPFFTTKRGAGGSGLGLHIVHNLVTQRLRGTIEVESVEGRGTEFRLRLPAAA